MKTKQTLVAIVLILVVTASFASLLPVQAVAPPSSGLKLWYKFNENTGLVAGDSSGNGNVGTLFNTTWVPGKNGYALSFNSTRHSILQAVNSPSLNVTGNAISVCAWLNTTYSGASFEAIMEKGAYESGEYALYISGDPGVGFIRWQMHDVGILDSISAVNDGSWHLLCGTYDGSLGSNQLKLYVDNSLNVQTTATGNIGTNSHNFTVSSRQNVGYWLDGKVDEVLLYGRALSLGEVQQVYSYGFQTTLTTTVTSTRTSTVTSMVTSSRTVTSTSIRTTTVTQSSSTSTAQLPLQIESNSTIVSYVITDKYVNITLYGPGHTIGAMNITILKSLVHGSPIILIDDGYTPVLTQTVTSDENYWIIQITYPHSLHVVQVWGSLSIAEFPAGLLPLFALSMLLPLVLLRRKKKA